MNDTEAFLKLDYSVLSIAKYDNISFSVLQKMIYCYYRDFYRSTNKPVYVSMSALATVFGSDNRVTIQNSVKKLERMGLLECVEANKGTSKKFIPRSLNLSLCTYTNSKKLKKGTNQDPERPVKPKAEVKVKEEIKQNPMPSAEPVTLSEQVSEKPSISTVESVEAVTVPHVDDSDLTKWVLDQSVDHEELNQNVGSKPEQTEIDDFDDVGDSQYVDNINITDFLKGRVYLSYQEFKKCFEFIGAEKENLSEKARTYYAAYIQEHSEEIPF